MPASTAATPSPNPRSFAGLLADYAAPEKKFPPTRDLDGLADDIATLSYEHVLRTHARYHSADAPSASPSEQEPALATSRPATLTPQPVPGAAAGASSGVDARKCASITVRLTVEEDHRLRGRAAEAGLTISAYLRSCAFEVESLRAEVKQTISELRRKEPQPAPAPLWARIAPWRHRQNQKQQRAAGT